MATQPIPADTTPIINILAVTTNASYVSTTVVGEWGESPEVAWSLAVTKVLEWDAQYDLAGPVFLRNMANKWGGLETHSVASLRKDRADSVI